LLILTLSILMLPGIASATDCTVGSCSGDSYIMDLSADTNAHGSLKGQGTDCRRLCCDDIADTGSNEVVILQLSGTSNAHACTTVSGGDCDTPYGYEVKVYTDDASETGLTCRYASSGDCTVDEICVVALSGQTNAHLAKCGTSGYHPICCEVTTDTENPTITDNYTYGGTWVNGEHTIAITATDTGSGVDRIQSCWGAGCTPTDCSPIQGQGTEEATYTVTIQASETKDDITFRYRAIDTVGNPSDIGGIASVRIDNTYPVTICPECPSEDQVVGTFIDVDLTILDEHSGIQDTYWCYYKSPDTDCLSGFQLYSDTVSLGSDCIDHSCSYSIKYYSVDMVGNQEAPPEENKNMIYDDSFPSCEFNDGLPVQTNSQTVHLEWDANDPITGSLFKKYEISASKSTDGGQSYTVPEGETVEITTEDMKTHDFTVSEDGHYRFSCTVTYQRDIYEPSSLVTGYDLYAVLVDTQVPTVHITSPDSEYVNQEEFTISWTGSDGDGSGIDHYNLSVNGTVKDDNIPEDQTSYQYTGGQSGQSYEIEITAYDMVGNPSLPDIAAVTMDTEPPACSMASLEKYTTTTTFDLAWSSTDQDAESYEICLREEASDCTNILSDWKDLIVTSKEFIGAHGNTYYFRCRATDRAGNTGEWSPPENTTIDAKAPVLAGGIPDYPSTMISSDYDDMEINSTVTDGFGIKNVSLVISGTEISPKEKTGTTGDTQWTLRWEIPYDTYAAETEFSIILSDVNGNADTQDFTYLVYQCNPGEYRECDPEDPATEEPYTQGVCSHTGNRTCGSDGMWSSNCTGGTFPTDETCNGLDDDCDGEVDDGLESQPCGPLDKVTTGKSICRLGAKNCVNGTWSACEDARYPENKEICNNGWDDDCDGVEDNGCDCDKEGETHPCGESNVGICKLGSQICESGHLSSCQNAVYPETEICSDSFDNDCDGYTNCDDSDCYGSPVCEGAGPEPEEFPWWLLSVIGVIILVVLAVLLLHLKRHGEELTWETVKKKWSY